MTGEDCLHSYASWGLNIRSELECPELLPGSGEADVVIHLGKTPEKLPTVKTSGVCFEMNEEAFLLKVDGVATYWVTGGNRIVIEPHTPEDSRSIRLFLLGSAFGALLHQRGLPPFHGSAVAMNGHAVLIVGPSAAGKSTLAAELCRRGHTLLADDVCVLRLENEAPPIVLPAYPQAKLWADMLKTMKIEKEGLCRVRSQLDKYALPLEDAFCRTPLPVAAVYILHAFNGDDIEVEPVKGQEKFMALNNHTYRLRFLEGLENKSAHYRICAAIAKYAAVIRVRRPFKPFRLKKLADYVEGESFT